jgi:hypothetical protein
VPALGEIERGASAAGAVFARSPAGVTYSPRSTEDTLRPMVPASADLDTKPCAPNANAWRTVRRSSLAEITITGSSGREPRRCAARRSRGARQIQVQQQQIGVRMLLEACRTSRRRFRPRRTQQLGQAAATRP